MMFASGSTEKTVEYIWLAGNIDMMINCICIFFMMFPNRLFCCKLVSCGFCCNKNVKYLEQEIKSNEIPSRKTELTDTCTVVSENV